MLVGVSVGLIVGLPTSLLLSPYYRLPIILTVSSTCLILGTFLGCCTHKKIGSLLKGKDRATPEDSATFTTAFGWALESYKEEIEGFEIFNVISRTLIIAGSAIMYPDNRFTTYIIVMSWSLLLHMRFCPYTDQGSNMCAILFCICDILGALSASGGIRAMFFANVFVLQMFFILVTFSTMAIVGVTIIRGIRAQKFAESKKKLRSTCTTTNDIFASYTPLEKKLLFPVLAIVWLLVTCLQKIEKKRGNNRITPLTENQENSIEIVPMEEKVSEEDE